ncbi:MAG: ABC transporter ATPase [Capnocytophaga sp.]|nr:ABC transporter ATPase [Capnocytophaga sp.]
MFVPFSSLPETSRVWIYQANRELSETEITEIKQLTVEYLNTWAAHGTPIRNSFEIRYSRFLVIAADDNQYIGGCSLDDLGRFIQVLEKKYAIDLLDKMNVSFRKGEEIIYVPLTEFKKMGQQKLVSNETIVFNNLVTNLYEYQRFWETPAIDSWHSRFMK